MVCPASAVKPHLGYVVTNNNRAKLKTEGNKYVVSPPHIYQMVKNMPSLFLWLVSLSLLVIYCLADSNPNSFSDQGSSSAAIASAWIDRANHNNEDDQLPTLVDLKGSGVVLSKGDTCSAAGQAPTERRLGRGIRREDSAQGESCGNTRSSFDIPFGYRLATAFLNLKNVCHLFESIKEDLQCLPHRESAQMPS